MRRLKLDFHAVGDVGFGVLAINAASFDGVGAGTSATGGTTMGGGGGSSSLTAAASSDTSTMFASTPTGAPSSDDDESSFDDGGGSPQSEPSSAATGSTGSPKAADGDRDAALVSSKDTGGSSMTARP